MYLLFTEEDCKEYSENALDFLKEYQWIYKYPNTQVLVKNVFDNFESEWIPHFKNLSYNDLNSLPYDLFKVSLSVI